MFCCDLSPQVIPSPEGTRWALYLKYVAIGHLLLGVCYFIGGGSLLAMGLMDLIFAWFVFISYRTMNYCFLTMYIWFLLFNLLTTFVYIGTFVQFPDKIEKGDKGWMIYFIILFCISFIFYCIAVYIAYRAYKEFKALAMYPYVEGADDVNNSGCILDKITKKYRSSTESTE